MSVRQYYVVTIYSLQYGRKELQKQSTITADLLHAICYCTRRLGRSNKRQRFYLLFLHFYISSDG